MDLLRHDPVGCVLMGLLLLAVRHGSRVANAAEAYDRMMSGREPFRVVLDIAGK